MTRRGRTLASACVLGVCAAASAAPPAAPTAPSAPTAPMPGSVVVVEHRDPTVAPTRGPTTALVTVELFFAPTPNLQARLPAYKMIEKLQAKHPTRVRVIYRIMKRGSQGPLLPITALEAHAQGKFFELMDKLHTVRTNLTRDQIVDLGKQIGMDPQRLDAALTTGADRYRDVLDDNEHRFDRLHGNTSPNALFNGKAMRSIGSLGESEYEGEFKGAYERALDLLDHGVDPKALAQAFDDQALRGTQPFIISSGPTDVDDPGGDPSEHPLANPPLQLEGLPSFGKPDATAQIPIVVLCRPNDAGCNNTLRIVRGIQEMYADEVRVLWGPYFDVTRDDAAELTMLGDAALCAERVGSSPDDMSASPGWRWITKQLEQASRAHGRRVPAEKLIDSVAIDLGADGAKMAGCRARLANATLDWVANARRSGISRSPALVIGGRIYEGLADRNVIQQLIEAELAPGVLGEVAPSKRRTSR